MSKRDDIREDLFEIESNEFPDFAADLWDHRGYDIEENDGRRAGFKATESGGFFGSSTTELVEPIYRGSDKVNKSDVNRVLDYRWDDDIDEIVVVTTTEFTEGARKQGKRDEVEVLNGEELAEVIAEENAERVLHQYLPNGSILKGLFWLCVVLPLKITWFVITLPFKILSGSNDSES